MTITSLNTVDAPIAFAGFQPSSASTASVGPIADESRGANLLERLIQLSLSNDHFIAELKVAQRRLRQAVDYTSDRRSRADVGAALVALARRKHERVLARLRVNRSEAIAILAQLASSF